MRRFWTIVFISALSGSLAWTSPVHAQADEEPPVQPGDDVGDFGPGAGSPAANNDSVYAAGARIGFPAAAGSGCQRGTVNATLSPDQRALTVLFDRFTAEAGRNVGTKRDIRICQISIPFQVPAGFQFSVVKVAFRGFTAVPEGGRARFISLFSMNRQQADGKSPRRIRRQTIYPGPTNDDFIIHSDLRAKRFWSACGRNTDLTIETRVIARSNRPGDPALATLDSMDMSAGETEYHLLWRECRPSR